MDAPHAGSLTLDIIRDVVYELEMDPYLRALRSSVMAPSRWRLASWMVVDDVAAPSLGVSTVSPSRTPSL